MQHFTQYVRNMIIDQSIMPTFKQVVPKFHDIHNISLQAIGLLVTLHMKIRFFHFFTKTNLQVIL